MTAGGTSTCASPINNSQTTAVLASTSGFPVPLAFQQFSALLLDTGDPAYLTKTNNGQNPLAVNNEYVFVTGNNQGTNTLTWIRGQEGSTAKSFFAGATVAAMPLPSDLTQSFMQKIGDSTLTGLATTLGTFTIPTSSPGPYTGLLVVGRAQGNGAQVSIGYQFNSDTVNDYAYQHIFNVGSGAQGTGPTVTNSALCAVAAINSSASWISYIGTPNSTALTNHTVTSTYSSATVMGHLGAYWNQSSAITSLVVVATGNCISGSYVEVFGIP